MKTHYILILLLLLGMTSFADGILTSQNKNYPGLFLKNKSTEITVNIDGLVVETIVKQEFENEWNQTVNATFSFPVPLDAHVTRLLYSKGDTLVDAILDVIPQSTNPGTGTDDIIARLNEYMGPNAVRINLTNILPNGVKWVELHYISKLKHANGVCSYKYPFDTKSFLTYPLDYLKLDINVHSGRTIADFNMPSHSGLFTVSSTPNDLKLAYIKQQVYSASDILFNYTIENSLLNIDFYSTKDGNNDGYYMLIGRPVIATTDINSFPANIVFLLSNSTSMSGNKLNQSIQAISASLDKLTTKDTFNILLSNYSTSYWQSQPVVASSANIQNAKAWLSSVVPVGGSDLNSGLTYSINQLKNKVNPASVLVFTDGISLLSPSYIESINTQKAGIFVVAIGNKIDRLKLEKLTNLNYGFVSYLSESDNLSAEMIKVFDKIRLPILKDVNITIQDAGQFNLYPAKFQAIYANSDFIVTGRYKTPGPATINVNGFEINGYKMFPYQVNFSNTMSKDFSRTFWSKYAIDDKESDILINGETPEKIEALINLSLFEKMRCRFTAYVEDSVFNSHIDSIYMPVEIPTTSLYETILGGKSEIKIFPNPVSSQINLQFTINQKDADSEKYVKIYDLTGNLLYTIKLTAYKAGTYNQSFYLPRLSETKQMLILRFEIAGKTISAIKLLKL